MKYYKNISILLIYFVAVYIFILFVDILVILTEENLIHICTHDTPIILDDR